MLLEVYKYRREEPHQLILLGSRFDCCVGINTKAHASLLVLTTALGTDQFVWHFYLTQ